MNRTIWIYGLALALLVLVMKMIQYHFWIRELTIEFYIGIVAFLFTGLGVWAGLHFTRKKTAAPIQVPAEKTQVFSPSSENLEKLGISKRELEVLELMSLGLSNQEIADKLFVSLNTVKTHAANLFLKLEVSRRTQAVVRGRELRIIP